MTRLTLAPITYEMLRAVAKTKVKPSQEGFVAPNALSIAEAYFVKEHWFRAIMADKAPVGFVMIHTQIEEDCVYLWRFMIDAPAQGEGYGREALRLILREIQTWPGVHGLRLSFVRGEGGPEAFYLRNNFRLTGREIDGEIEAEYRFG
ncbi:MAG TPA: GNAT family N-acetyltransferase [Alphaproteobacteria bacterium]|nr:GNAT family N-acetyltransferase [Alphaproteobacteria bacterium]